MYFLLNAIFNNDAHSRQALLRLCRYYVYVRFSSFFKLSGLAEFFTGKFMAAAGDVMRECASNVDTSHLEELCNIINQTISTQAHTTAIEFSGHALILFNGIKEIVIETRGHGPLLSKVKLAMFASGFTAFLGFVVLFAYWDSIPLVRNSKIARAKIQLLELNKRFSQVKAKYILPLSSITGRSCSYCPCKTGADSRKMPLDDICVKQWRDSVTKILALSGMDISQIKEYYADPWGSPFGLDELDAAGSCNADVIVSPGPSGIFGASDNVKTTLDKLFCKTSQ